MTDRNVKPVRRRKWLVGCGLGCCVILACGVGALAAFWWYTGWYLEAHAAPLREDLLVSMADIGAVAADREDHVDLLNALTAVSRRPGAGYFGLFMLDAVLRECLRDRQIVQSEWELLAQMREFLEKNPAPNALEMDRFAAEHPEVEQAINTHRTGRTR